MEHLLRFRPWAGLTVTRISRYRAKIYKIGSEVFLFQVLLIYRGRFYSAGGEFGNQAREEAAVHSLEAPSDPNWKPISAADGHPKIYVFRFQVLCICRGRFFLFFSFRWWKYFARISTSYRTRPRDDAPEANVDLTPLR